MFVCVRFAYRVNFTHFNVKRFKTYIAILVCAYSFRNWFRTINLNVLHVVLNETPQYYCTHLNVRRINDGF